MYKGTRVSYEKHQRRVRGDGGIPLPPPRSNTAGNETLSSSRTVTSQNTPPSRGVGIVPTVQPSPRPPTTTQFDVSNQHRPVPSPPPPPPYTDNNNNNTSTQLPLSSKAQKMLGIGTTQNDVVDLSFTVYVYKLHGMSPPPPPPPQPQPQQSQQQPSYVDPSIPNRNFLGDFATKITSSVQTAKTNLTISTAQTTEQLKKTIETTIPAVQFEKLPIEQLLHKKRPEHIFELAANNGVLLVYKEAIIVGVRTGGNSVEIRSLVPLAGPGAEEKGFVTDLRGLDLQVDDVTIHAQDEEEKREWIKTIASVIAASRGLTWHLAIRGTVWSAVAFGDLEALSTFHGVEVNATDHIGRCALHYAAESTSGGQAVALLLGTGADPNTLDDELASPLHLAARAGNALGIHALLRGGADPESKDLLERTAFFLATEEAIQSAEPDPWLQVLEALAEGRADVEARDVKDRTPLHLASVLDDGIVSRDNNLTLMALLRAPIVADPNAVRGELKRTPLHMLAVLAGDDAKAIGRAGILLDHAARPNAVDGRGDTALMLLLRGESMGGGPGGGGYPITTSERMSFARLLIQYGARLDVVNMLGKTPLDATKAQRISFDDVVQKWQQRKEPEVARVMALDPNTMWNLPRAAEEGQATTGGEMPTHAVLGLNAVRARIAQGMSMANVSMPWQVDTDVTNCVGCKRAFSTMQRKIHCKHCGLVFCAACTSKTFVMSPPASFAGAPTPIRAKVCDGCFNSMSTLVDRVSDELHRLSVERTAASLRKVEKEKSQRQAESDKHTADMKRRNDLFGDASVSTTTPDDEMKQAQQGAHAAVSRSRELLNERGDAISRLAEKTDRMKDRAMAFESSAIKARQQAEKSWW